MVRSVERLDYERRAGGGRRRHRRRAAAAAARGRRAAGSPSSAARGGASLPMPEQEVDDATTALPARLPAAVPAEDWNAQISLMTGMAAADDDAAGAGRHPADHARARGQHGRPVPPAGPGAGRDLARGHRATASSCARSTATDPRHLALIHEATALFRGAGYTPVRRPAARADRPRRGRGGLRPRDGAAAPAGRPVRPGHLRGAVPRSGRCRRGSARACPRCPR